MKKIGLYLLMILGLGSCIQSEPLNTEADIIACKVKNSAGADEPNIRGNIILTNSKVIAQANPKIDLTQLSLQVELTEGATIFPDPAEVADYSLPRRFVVTSQDGNWQKEYMVSIDTFDMPVRYRFEHFELNETGKYQVFYEKIQGKDTVFKQYIWASGNSGYALTGVAASAEEYPTISVEKGRIQKGIKLETKSTGGFGDMVKMPIAAGNLFLGSFEVKNATALPLKATRFGLPFAKKPSRLKGWYKYQPGSGNFIARDRDKNTVVVPGQKDSGDIYAVLYESAGLEGNVLDGNNVLTSPNIVAMARVKVETTDSYTEFDIPFDYQGGTKISWPSFILRDASADGNGTYRAFSAEKLKNNEYNLAVVFTSSKYGAYFAGQVGSTLWVDEIQVVCENE